MSYFRGSGGVAYPLIVIQSQLEWNRINQIDFSGTTIPQFIFPRRDDFGIYPTPQDAYTVSLTSNLMMTAWGVFLQ